VHIAPYLQIARHITTPSLKESCGTVKDGQGDGGGAMKKPPGGGLVMVEASV
jgi:hypothetical protein